MCQILTGESVQNETGVDTTSDLVAGLLLESAQLTVRYLTNNPDRGV